MHIKHLPVIGSFIKLLDMKISEHGLQIGLLQLLKRSATTFQIQGITKETEEILRTKPVVIVAHHPFDAEVLCVLAALPPQENTYLVINNSYVGIVPSADKHLIPVYISHHRNGLDKRIFLEKFLLKFLPSKFFSEEMEHEKNKESIKFASQKLSENGTVVIFPNRRSPNGKWYNGVGYMITGVIKEQEVYVIPVVVHGTSNWDYLRIVPGGGKLLKPLSVYFGKPISSKQIHKNNPTGITRFLEEKYNKWLPTVG